MQGAVHLIGQYQIRIHVNQVRGYQISHSGEIKLAQIVELLGAKHDVVYYMWACAKGWAYFTSPREVHKSSSLSARVFFQSEPRSNLAKIVTPEGIGRRKCCFPSAGHEIVIRHLTQK